MYVIVCNYVIEGIVFTEIEKNLRGKHNKILIVVREE
jgi:hypothetical protein